MTGFTISKGSDENWVASSDGSTIYVAANDGYLKIYDAATGEQSGQVYLGGDLDGIAISPDGYSLAVTLANLSNERGYGDSYSALAHVVLVDTYSLNTQWHDIPVNGWDRSFGDLAFSTHSTLHLSQNMDKAGYTFITTLDLYSGQATRGASYYSDGTAPSLTNSFFDDTVMVGTLKHYNGQYSIISSSGYEIAASGYFDEYDLAYATGIEAFSGSFNGGHVAVFANGGLHLYDARFTKIATLVSYDGTSGDIAGLTFSEDGLTLYALDKAAGAILTFDLHTLEQTGQHDLPGLDYESLAYGQELTFSINATSVLVNTLDGIHSVALDGGSGGGDPADNDDLVGTEGDDVLDGGIGADRMTGLGGDDTYYVDNSGDMVIEDEGAGNDTVVTSLDVYTLADNVEDLDIFGDRAMRSLTGNGLDNQMVFSTIYADVASALEAYGMEGVDRIDARGLLSTYGANWQVMLDGGDGNDVLIGTSGGVNDMWGEAGEDDLSIVSSYSANLYGGADNDRLTASGSGNFLLDGGAGDDVMDGSGTTGYVYYVIDSHGDEVIFGTGQSYLRVWTETYIAPEGTWDITLSDAALAQTVTGTSGTNHIRSLYDNDTAIGCGGDDYYYISYGNAQIVEEEGGGYDRVTALGSDYTMALWVEEATVFGSHSLHGNEQDNILAGQSGHFYGGLGNDTYRIWESGTIHEEADSGIDTAIVSYAYVLPDNVENLLWRDYTYNRGSTLSGNTLDNVVTGSNGYDLLVGGDGSDTLYGDLEGGAVSGSYHRNDTLHGGADDDLLYGMYGDDVLLGGSGNDWLDGGTGSDTASYADALSRVVVRLHRAVTQKTEGGGRDTFVSIENLEGSAHADLLDGDSGANTLSGGAGDDRLRGFEDADVLLGEADADRLEGGDGDDRLEGGTGNDTLIGGAGADLMLGGADNDIYIVDADDTVTEEFGAGIDEVRMFGFDHTLADNVEILRIRGGAVSGTGNALDNNLYGSGNDNTLSGLGGNDLLDGKGGQDILIGGEGNDILVGGTALDTLTGGAGADRFVWRSISEGNASPGFADAITDFSQEEGDVISLDGIDAIAGGENDDFTFIGKSGFSGSAGELRFKLMDGDTIVQIDIDGDAMVDMSIRLDGEHDLTVDDFLGVSQSLPATQMAGRAPSLSFADEFLF